MSLLATPQQRSKLRQTVGEMSLLGRPRTLLNDGRNGAKANSGTSRQNSQVSQALAELYQLLEAYAPAWYGQEHHEMAEFALRSKTASAPKILTQLLVLLEEYSPAWYTREQREKARCALRSLKTSQVEKPTRRKTNVRIQTWNL